MFRYGYHSNNKNGELPFRRTRSTVTIYYYRYARRDDLLLIFCVFFFSLEKQDKFYLYLGGGLIGGLLSILCVVAAKFVWQRSRRHLDNKHKSDNASHDMSIDPNAFGDNISEVDADIDLTDITQFPITVIPTQQLSPSEVRDLLL